MDLQMHMDWCRGRFTISDGAEGTVEDNIASSVLKSIVSVYNDQYKLVEHEEGYLRY